jgi:hypothetical protein
MGEGAHIVQVQVGVHVRQAGPEAGALGQFLLRQPRRHPMAPQQVAKGLSIMAALSHRPGCIVHGRGPGSLRRHYGTPRHVLLAAIVWVNVWAVV